eukprot:GCRY01003296.1.p1 GENE.GCRY01003296.1~~GCRY01003296.1.p1  ORF type:complete len:333 (+),score=55.54 GCRY01003296.1:149-1147(+)
MEGIQTSQSCLSLNGEKITSSNTLVFSTAASAYFADLIAQKLNFQRGTIIRKTFGDGESYYRIKIEKRTDLLNRDAIMVGSTWRDDDFLEVVRVCSSLCHHGVRRLFVIIPFFGFSTMERAVLPGEIVSAKINAHLLSAIPKCSLGNVFMSLDLHTQGILHYFDNDAMVFELYAEEFLCEAIRALPVDFSNAVIASADLGRPKWVETFAKRFQTDMAFIRKARHFEDVNVEGVIGDVDGKSVIIYDDMTRSAKTLIKGAQAYIDKGAKEVFAVLSHLALNDTEKTLELIINSPIKKVIATNSHPNSQAESVRKCDKFIIVDCSDAFCECLTR